MSKYIPIVTIFPLEIFPTISYYLNGKLICRAKIMAHKMLRPDSKGRITLGHLADGVSGFAVTQTKDHKIILEPFSEVPFREKWLHDNKAALKKVNQGLKDAKAGHIVKKGSFAKFTEDDVE